jgi:hypothetical protein
MLAYADFELNETISGKKSFGVARGALNSKEPDLLFESIKGRFHNN